MAKCKYWSREGKLVLNGLMTKHCLALKGSRCPLNTDTDCNVLRTKKKPRYKRIKSLAFEFIDNDGKKKWTAFPRKVGLVKHYPCTILIEAKYLKGDTK